MINMSVAEDYCSNIACNVVVCLPDSPAADGGSGAELLL